MPHSPQSPRSIYHIDRFVAAGAEPLGRVRLRGSLNVEGFACFKPQPSCLSLATVVTGSDCPIHTSTTAMVEPTASTAARTGRIGLGASIASIASLALADSLLPTPRETTRQRVSRTLSHKLPRSHRPRQSHFRDASLASAFASIASIVP